MSRVPKESHSSSWNPLEFHFSQEDGEDLVVRFRNDSFEWFCKLLGKIEAVLQMLLLALAQLRLHPLDPATLALRLTLNFLVVL